MQRIHIKGKKPEKRKKKVNEERVRDIKRVPRHIPSALMTWGGNWYFPDPRLGRGTHQVITLLDGWRPDKDSCDPERLSLFWRLAGSHGDGSMIG